MRHGCIAFLALARAGSGEVSCELVERRHQCELLLLEAPVSVDRARVVVGGHDLELNRVEAEAAQSLDDPGDELCGYSLSACGRDHVEVRDPAESPSPHSGDRESHQLCRVILCDDGDRSPVERLRDVTQLVVDVDVHPQRLWYLVLEG